MRYKELEDIVINTWIEGLHKNKQYDYVILFHDLGKLDLPFEEKEYVQLMLESIIEEYYETDRRDTELEAKYHNPE